MIFRKSKPTADAPIPAAPEAPQKARAAANAGPSILTADVVLEGNMATNGELQIDGTVHGAVRAAVCIIEANGAVHGAVAAEEVFVRGRVIGPICGVHVTVVAGGHVEGDVLNQSIAIENGAYIDGKIRRSEDPMTEWQQMWYGEEPEQTPEPAPEQQPRLSYEDPAPVELQEDSTAPASPQEDEKSGKAG